MFVTAKRTTPRSVSLALLRAADLGIALLTLESYTLADVAPQQAAALDAADARLTRASLPSTVPASACLSAPCTTSTRPRPTAGTTPAHHLRRPASAATRCASASAPARCSDGTAPTGRT